MKQWIEKIIGNLPLPIKYRFHICFEKGCAEVDSTPCYLPDNEDQKPDEFYCSKHAHAAGYCWMCGQFNGGIESFDFLNKAGVCDNCESEIDEEEDYEDDSDWDWNAWESEGI